MSDVPFKVFWEGPICSALAVVEGTTVVWTAPKGWDIVPFGDAITSDAMLMDRKGEKFLIHPELVGSKNAYKGVELVVIRPAAESSSEDVAAGVGGHEAYVASEASDSAIAANISMGYDALWQVPSGWEVVPLGWAVRKEDHCLNRDGGHCPVSSVFVGKPNAFNGSTFVLIRHIIAAAEASAAESSSEDVAAGDVVMAGGKVATSKCPQYNLIPTVALNMVADQFSLGKERKKGRAWNAESKNQEVLLDKPFALARVNNIIRHAMQARDRILNDNYEDLATENDAAAVAWGGMFLCCVFDAQIKHRKQAAIGMSIDEQMQDQAAADAIADEKR